MLTNENSYAFRNKDGTITRHWGAGYGEIWELCERCNGDGEEEGEYGPKACGVCGGRGEVGIGYDPDGDRKPDAQEFIRDITMALWVIKTNPEFAFRLLKISNERRLRIIGVFQ